MIKKISLIALALILIPTIGCNNQINGDEEVKEFKNNSSPQVMPKETPNSQSTKPIFVEDYEKAVAIADQKPLLVVFGTEWCGYCVKLKKEMKNFDLTNYVICIVDADEKKDLAREFKVKSYPTSFIIKNEEIKSKKTGYRKSDYSNWIEENR